MTMIRSFCLVAGAVLGFGSPVRGADPTGALVDGLRELRAASAYSWSVSTAMPGAPFKVAPMRGRADASGWLVLETEADGQPRQAVGSGKKRVFEVRGAWKGRADLAALKGADERAALDLFAARTPVEELDALFPRLGGVRRDPDGSFFGALPEETAKEMISAAMAGRTPGGFIPELKAAVGNFRLWLRDGRPQKYVISFSATASLPFGTKEIKRVTTVEIGEVGSTRVEVPAAAKEKIETLSSR